MIFSRISFKLVLIVGISLLGMIALAPIALSTLRSQMIADRQAKTQHMVDVGYGILAHYQKLESDGKLSREQAQAGAMAEIKSLRYDKVEYFWINDMTPRMVMHPIKPELDGKDLSAMKDPAGNALFVGFVDVVKKQGAGFYGYLWPKPGFDQPVDDTEASVAARLSGVQLAVQALLAKRPHRHSSKEASHLTRPTAG
nr:cache domain-containing protein [Bradyrhizobium sp. SEMIA]